MDTMSNRPRPVMRKPVIAAALCDFYKVSHREQYPDKTEVVYSTWTPRSNKHYPEANAAIVFGPQGFAKEILIDFFNENFFNRDRQEVIDEYVRFIKYTLFVPDPPYQHIADLWDLGYMPLDIRCLKEGTRCPFRVPMLTVSNTIPKFYWVTNYVETIASSYLWMPSTSATTADLYRNLMDKWCLKTGGAPEFVPFQGHDFSMRGLPGLEAAILSGSGHLTGFVGTDTAPAIPYLERFYNANIETELVGTSVPATEHSVMCAGGADNEFDTYKRLVADVYPTGIISIVSDTWDLWHVVTDTLPKLKDVIMARDGGPESIDKVVIRPDSGDPVDIICGTVAFNSDLPEDYIAQLAKETSGSVKHVTPEEKGLIELLWETFGGTVNDEGFKVLDPCIGAIYGDSITLERCEAICSRLAAKGFCSTNVVFGIGAYTYQYKTRDSLGYAMKATSVVVDGVERQIFKDPKTDDGTKKSAKGAVKVVQGFKDLICIDELSLDEALSQDNLLEPMFYNGEMMRDESLQEIRERLNATR